MAVEEKIFSVYSQREVVHKNKKNRTTSLETLSL
jgi:hypothetical protein